MQRGEYKGVPAQDAQIVNTAGCRRQGQPGQETWMSIPVGVPNCPTGLEYLSAIDQLLIKQQVSLLEAFTNCERINKYNIKNALGQNVYFAWEQSDCCARFCCGNFRPFDLKILDNFQNEIMNIYRPLKCTGCCFPCCLQVLEVSSPPGTVIGTIEEEWSFLKPVYVLKNAAGDTVLRIVGPICKMRCLKDVNFHVMTMNDKKIGKISKQWGGLGREWFTDADYFGVNFPIDLDVRMKALVFAATFLIDFLYYENK